MAGARNTGSDECQNRGEEKCGFFPDKNLRNRSKGSFATAHKVPMLENRRWFYRGFRADGHTEIAKRAVGCFCRGKPAKGDNHRRPGCPCTHRRQRVPGSLRRSQATSRTLESPLCSRSMAFSFGGIIIDAKLRSRFTIGADQNQLHLEGPHEVFKLMSTCSVIGHFLPRRNSSAPKRRSGRWRRDADAIGSARCRWRCCSGAFRVAALSA